MDLYEKNNSLLNIVKGVAISIGFTFIALFIFSCLLVYTNINENLMQPIVIVITAISILLGSSIGNKRANKNGILNGALVGFIYMLLIYLFSSFNEINFSLNLQSAIISSGIVGGVIRRNNWCQYEKLKKLLLQVKFLKYWKLNNI